VARTLPVPWPSLWASATRRHAVPVTVDRPPVLRAILESGDTYDDPSEDALFLFFEDVEAGESSWLIVELCEDASGQTYAQALRLDDGRYLVEHRAGSADQHYSVTVADCRAAHAILTAWCVLPCRTAPQLRTDPAGRRLRPGWNRERPELQIGHRRAGVGPRGSVMPQVSVLVLDDALVDPPLGIRTPVARCRCQKGRW
jgi:hypothetical protein